MNKVTLIGHTTEQNLRVGSFDAAQEGEARTRARALVTTTPRPMLLLERTQEEALTITRRERTSNNINLDEKLIEC